MLRRRRAGRGAPDGFEDSSRGVRYAFEGFAQPPQQLRGWPRGPARPPDHMDRYLREFQYPARKRYLIDQARIQEVPSDVVHVLRRLPDREYLGAEQVAQAAREQA